MCGITGFSNFNSIYKNNQDKWNNILCNMTKEIEHRGKDAFGKYLNDYVGLGHARLSIRDVANGNQPIIRMINGCNYVIIYNGEIYKTDTLRKDLITKGYTFETTTDTEIILYSYIEYGEKCVNLLNGIFSFAIWNDTKEELFLCRDRLGIKPLFYTIFDDTLVFSSEIKSLFKYPNIKPEIDLSTFREIFGLGPARSSGNGVFKDIYEVKPAHFAIFSKNGFKQVNYWRLESKPHTDTYEETLEKVKYLVIDSIESQMISDVPVCTFLSGGIDSSIVTSVAGNFLNKNGKILNTFSFDFTENDKYFKSNSFQPERDKPFIDIMLKNFKTNHKFLECNEVDLSDYLYKAVDAKDLPGMADIDSSMLYFCSLVAKYNKVALTGECADEIFGGYPWFYRDDLFNTDTFPWSRNLELRNKMLNSDLRDKLDLKNYVQYQYETSINDTPQLYGENLKERRRREIAYLNINWFMSTLLDRMDRCSMFHGLESRVPFADHRIVEYLWNVPWDMKYRNNCEKHLLREATKSLLPDEIYSRKKSPYPKTYNPKYEKILKDKLNNIINDNNSPILNIIDKQNIIDFMNTETDYSKPWFGQLMSGPQMLAYLIQIDYWLNKFNISFYNIN